MANKLPNIGLPKVNVYHESDVLIKLADKTYKPGKNKKPLLIISGTSGAGKDTIVDLLPMHFQRVITCTTRIEVRENEKDFDPYIRLDEKDFLEQVEKGDFIEHKKYGEYYYGTRKNEIHKISQENKIPILRVDPQGGKSYASGEVSISGYSHLYFFILPPSKQHLKRRLFGREVGKLDDPLKKKEGIEKVRKRMDLFSRDIELSVHAHYWVINLHNQAEQVASEISNKVADLIGKKALVLK